MNLKFLFSKAEQPIPESTDPNAQKAVKKKKLDPKIERSKNAFAKKVEQRYKASIMNKTYKFPR